MRDAHFRYNQEQAVRIYKSFYILETNQCNIERVTQLIICIADV